MLKDGISFSEVRDEKFKSFLLSISFHTKLSRDTITKSALLPRVLRKATVNYPELAKINSRLEYLYGAHLEAMAVKTGEGLNIVFLVNALNDQFTKDKTAKQAVELLFEMVFSPLIKDGVFAQDVVDLEKQALKNSIEALINNKRKYSVIRMHEEMCSDEAFGTRFLGYGDHLPEINPKNLHEHYLDILANSPVDVCFAGNTEGLESITEFATKKLEALKPRASQYHRAKVLSAPAQIKTITEPMDVTQGKLVMGFRAPDSFSDSDYFKLLVYNSILGGDAHSKLFLNVRERLSLCYYAWSEIDHRKSIVTVSSGIEFDKYQGAKNEILAQMENIRQGNITELEASKSALTNAFRQRKDDVMALWSHHHNQLDLPESLSVEQSIELINSVTIDQVVQVANQIQPDTFYFLTGKDFKMEVNSDD